MNAELTPVTEEHKSVLSHLIQLYCHDFSEIRGYDLTAHGTFTYRYLDHYFTEDTREACLITAGGALAGFTMTRRLDNGGREVSEFFVVRRHRRHGTGPRPRSHDIAKGPQPNRSGERLWSPH